MRRLFMMFAMLYLSLELYANGNKTNDIEMRWKATPQYQKYLALKKASKMKEADVLQRKTVLVIAHEMLQGYIEDFKPKYRKKMAQKVEALPFGLKTVLADAYCKGKALLSKNHLNPKDLNKFAGGLYWYIDSIKDAKGITEKKALALEKKFPELNGTYYMELLLKIGKNYDEIDKSDEAIRKSDEAIRKYEEENKKWDKMIKMLQALP